jgi:predicted nucleotide-binding protein
MNQKIYDSIKEAYENEYGWKNVEIKELAVCFGGWIGVVSGGRNHEEICFVYPDTTVRIFGNTPELVLFLERRAQSSATQTSRTVASRKIFVVHGHDKSMRDAVARFLQEIEFEPVILHEQASGGRGVIEKIEAYSDVGFAVVLLSPDDEGCVRGGALQPRVRQNVLLELGFFVGLLSRARVCPLKNGDVEIPSDWAGVIAVDFDGDAGGWKRVLGQNLQAAGYEIDWNLVMR